MPAMFSWALSNRGQRSRINSRAFFPFKKPVRLICIILLSGFCNTDTGGQRQAPRSECEGKTVWLVTGSQLPSASRLACRRRHFTFSISPVGLLTVMRRTKEPVDATAGCAQLFALIALKPEHLACRDHEWAGTSFPLRKIKMK